MGGAQELPTTDYYLLLAIHCSLTTDHSLVGAGWQGRVAAHLVDIAHALKA